MPAIEPRIGTPEREAWQKAKNRAAKDLAELLAARAAKDMEYWTARLEARATGEARSEQMVSQHAER